MKNFPKYLTILAGLALLATPSLRAADAAADQAPADKPKQERRERGPGGPGAMMERMSKELGLTAEQEAKWKAIAEQERPALKAIRDDASLSQEEKRAKAQELNKTYAEQRRAVLTPDQQTKFDEMRAKMRERGPRGGEGGPKREKKG